MHHQPISIHAVRALSDNYIWIIRVGDDAIVIDAGESEPVIDFVSTHQLSPIAFIITHHNAHAAYDDHTAGLPKLKQTYPNMTVYGHQTHDSLVEIPVDEGDTFELLGLNFLVWRTAGHTDTHLSYLVTIDHHTHVFCGDTLFSGGCGRVFSGTMSELHASLQRYNTLAGKTLFYPAHEYTQSNLKFGKHIEPDNTDIDKAIADNDAKLSQGLPTLPVTLAHERAINVFLHCDDQAVVERLIELGALDSQSHTSQDVFMALRTLKNSF